MNIDTFFAELDSYFEKNDTAGVDAYLTASLAQAKEEEDYAAYISIANEMIGFYRSVSAFEKSYAAAEDVLLLMEELKLEDTEHFATTLINAATAYSAGGEYAQALRLYRQAAQIDERVLKPDDYRWAGLYNNMSILLEKLDENEEAVACAEKALAVIEKQAGGEAQTATTLTNLALLCFKLSKNNEAKEHLSRAIALFEKEKDADAINEHYSGALAGMGEACYRDGEYEQSLSYYERALEDVKCHYGENMSYGILCENCAAVCGAMGDEKRQKMYEEKAREVIGRLRGFT
ncbi:MAG: tetratricopeptide repeat protein [Bacteroidales bacterium]|nr:tetratricopeptide repeat protein [Bacteroidales bacterium]MCM1415949.1 tetratricopeptide repeat protein [bacterium]MCM1423555.1 tetratricopeptide repeat protein [bacterium]